jgi:hypothetical protein
MALASQPAAIAELRARLERMAGHGGNTAAALPFGIEDMDEHLPGGGLCLGHLHEVMEAGPASEHAAIASIFGIWTTWHGKRGSEERERPIFIEREPRRCLARLGVGVFAERIERHDAAMLDIEPRPPMRARGVADVGDRRTTELWGPWHAPTGKHQLAHAITRVANNRRGIVGEDARHLRQIAGEVAHRAGKSDDRCLPVAETVTRWRAQDCRDG